VQAGASIQISQDYSSMVNFARCKCLGANVLRGPDQIPWDGKLNYDWQLWIDSDIVFNTEKFWQLVLMDRDIASGWYATEDGVTTSVAHWLEEDDFDFFPYKQELYYYPSVGKLIFSTEDKIYAVLYKDNFLSDKTDDKNNITSDDNCNE
jgi:hypothetical protein